MLIPLLHNFTVAVSAVCLLSVAHNSASCVASPPNKLAWLEVPADTPLTSSHPSHSHATSAAVTPSSASTHLESVQLLLALLQGQAAVRHGCECVDEGVGAEDAGKGLLQADLLEADILVGTHLRGSHSKGGGGSGTSGVRHCLV